jgi:hypothetical protein
VSTYAHGQERIGAREATLSVSCVVILLCLVMSAIHTPPRSKKRNYSTRFE